MTLGNLKGEATSFLNKYKSENPAAYAAAEQAVGGLLILDGFIGIDNPLGGKKRPGIFGSLTGVVVGVVFMLASTFFGNVTGINKLTATTNATIVSVGQPQVSQTRNSNGTTSTSSSCSATAKYTVNGKTYTQQSSMSSSGMCGFTVGATIPINYDPANPGNWGSDIKTVKTIFKVFFWAGLAVVASSIVTFLIRLASIIFGWKLLKNGRALAKTLPPGTDLSGTIKQIEHEFKTSLFGFGGGTPTAPAATPPVVPTPPSPVAPTMPPQPPAEQVVPQQQTPPPQDPQNQL